MAGHRVPMAQIEARLAELDALSRTRALTHPESDERDNLEYRRTLRLTRLHYQIEATTAKLQRLQAMVRA
tara:strand:+ start:2875 stop:3084 length:210 start_codon:yes stop_codon:yes gene_type:complete